MPEKANILIVGSGGIGTLTALTLELGGRASVTAVLRSNYPTVQSQGFTIDSCDHGRFTNWKPTTILNHIPSASPSNPFEYIICTTKNLPEIPPSLPDLIRPAVTPGISSILLLQNGLNIHLPILSAFPTNICLSGVTTIGAYEQTPGHVLGDITENLIISPFLSPNQKAPSKTQVAAAKKFVEIYSSCPSATCSYDPRVEFIRWRKLVYNSVWNPVCALTDLDTTRLRFASAAEPGPGPDPVSALVRPAMREICAAAKAVCGVEFSPEGTVEGMIDSDPLEVFTVPSMLQDRRRGAFMEYEFLVGEALREGEKAGVEMSVVRCLYGLCKAVQWKVKEERGMVSAEGMLEQSLERERKGEAQPWSRC